MGENIFNTLLGVVGGSVNSFGDFLNGQCMNYDKYLQNEVLNKLKLSTKCNYNDNK